MRIMTAISVLSLEIVLQFIENVKSLACFNNSEKEDIPKAVQGRAASFRRKLRLNAVPRRPAGLGLRGNFISASSRRCGSSKSVNAARGLAPINMRASCGSEGQAVGISQLGGVIQDKLSRDFAPSNRSKSMANAIAAHLRGEPARPLFRYINGSQLPQIEAPATSRDPRLDKIKEIASTVVRSCYRRIWALRDGII